MRSRDALLADTQLVQKARNRFASKLQQSGECVLYQGSKAHNGYGEFWLCENNVRAHRFAFVLEHGRLPKGIVMHTCDTPACCNPDHLVDGTVFQNVQDRVNKGRSGGAQKGERHHNATLTERRVQSIKRLRGVERRLLAAAFQTSVGNIASIQTGKTWKHVTLQEA